MLPLDKVSIGTGLAKASVREVFGAVEQDGDDLPGALRRPYVEEHPAQAHRLPRATVAAAAATSYRSLAMRDWPEDVFNGKPKSWTNEFRRRCRGSPWRRRPR